MPAHKSYMFRPADFLGALYAVPRNREMLHARWTTGNAPTTRSKSAGARIVATSSQWSAHRWRSHPASV